MAVSLVSIVSQWSDVMNKSTCNETEEVPLLINAKFMPEVKAA